MTDSLAIQALKLFGYADTEARFLRLVALHSGVFPARQFNLFSRAKTGYRVDAFIKKLKSNRHCNTYRLGKNAAMFHLHSKAIYRAIGHENLRHRRSHQANYVKTKLRSETMSFKIPPCDISQLKKKKSNCSRQR